MLTVGRRTGESQQSKSRWVRLSLPGVATGSERLLGGDSYARARFSGAPLNSLRGSVSQSDHYSLAL
jgi:hypothetical protein